MKKLPPSATRFAHHPRCAPSLCSCEASSFLPQLSVDLKHRPFPHVRHRPSTSPFCHVKHRPSTLFSPLEKHLHSDSWINYSFPAHLAVASGKVDFHAECISGGPSVPLSHRRLSGAETSRSLPTPLLAVRSFCKSHLSLVNSECVPFLRSICQFQSK